MPNLKNAKKRVKVIETKRESNNEFKASMKTAIKKTLNSIKKNDKEEAQSNLNSAIKKIDKAVQKGVVHANKGARNKSNITKKVNNME